MRKEIYLPIEVKREIAKDFKTTHVTVWSALTFRTKSRRANMIRAAAIERGGTEVVYNGPKVV